MHRPIIFDFDGVIVDTEPAANQALAECLSEAGFRTSYDEAVATYIGLRMRDCLTKAEAIHGSKLPPHFADTCRARTAALLGDTLQPVPGAVEFIRACVAPLTAIASSSSERGIKRGLAQVGLEETFEGRIFSAAEIERGKPHPDIFLMAASGIGAMPTECIVIEDGVLGTQGAVAAGMTVIGLTAGSHCTPAHATRLSAAGARHIAASYLEVAGILRSHAL